MPLRAYFSTAGVLLVALLLLTNFWLDPRLPMNAKPATTGAETKLANLEVDNPASRQAVGVTRALPSTPDPYALPPRAVVQTEQPAPAAEPQRKSSKPKRKSAQVRAQAADVDDPWRQFGRQPAYAAPAYSDSRYDSRAGLRTRRSSSAQGTLGPH